jgi:hypothetical protein
MRSSLVKRLLIFLVIATGLLVVGYGIHDAFNNSLHVTVPYSLISIYLFFYAASIVVYGLSEGVNLIDPNKTGYAFLAMTMMKFGFFIVIFYQTTLAKDELSKGDKLGIIVPLFLFIFLESAAVFRFLNKQ